jgi:hypothetical protein
VAKLGDSTLGDCRCYVGRLSWLRWEIVVATLGD